MNASQYLGLLPFANIVRASEAVERQTLYKGTSTHRIVIHAQITCMHPIQAHLGNRRGGMGGGSCKVMRQQLIESNIHDEPSDTQGVFLTRGLP